MSHALDRVLSTIDGGLDQSCRRLFDLLRIPSVSTDPAFDAECWRAAHWMVAELSDLGFAASVRPTTGKPMVVAHWPLAAATDRSGVLFYGHYDVQPPDPLELWETAPFEPWFRDAGDGRRQIVARGASDDKGQLMTFVEACRAWIAETGDLPVPVTILLEGEEETGSPSLAPFLDAHKDELTKSIALVCDTTMLAPGRPAITASLRGIWFEELTVTGPDRDLHSGLYGGPAHNPIRVLSRILAALHDDTGRIAIPHFYDGVASPGAGDETATGFDGAALLAGVGLSVPAGEAGFSIQDQLWTRPSCDVNGIWGGYTADGSKTVIPSQAHAKLSFRLVGGQDPAAISDRFRVFVQDRLPADCTVRFRPGGGGPGLTVDATNPAMVKARAALHDEFGCDAALIGAGFSIPIVTQFKHVFEMDSLLIGFALDDDCVHSPNEKYDLASFHRGTRSWARVLAALA